MSSTRRVCGCKRCAPWPTPIARGVIHRDVKPSNLFLTQRDGDEGPEELLKVIDFSVALILSDESETRPTKPGDLVGTWLYMAPEQQSSGPVSPQPGWAAIASHLWPISNVALGNEATWPVWSA